MRAQPIILFAICLALANEVSFVARHDAPLLMNSLIAENVTLTANKSSLVPDLRKSATPIKSRIISEVIDPSDIENNGVANDFTLLAAEITIQATNTEKSSIEISVRSGNSFYSAEGWSEWQSTRESRLKLSKPKGKYLQYRILIVVDTPDRLPEISAVSINAFLNSNQSKSESFSVKNLRIEKNISSSVPFEYEEPFFKPYVELSRKLGYDTAWNNGKNELEKLFLLNTAVARTPNSRHSGWNTNYPFDAREICFMDNGVMTIQGHCMSYAAVLIAALTSVGKYARHWCVNGFRDADHEVVEVWSDSLRKWIHFDPSLSQYYLNPDSKIPMSILEQHNAYVGFVLRDGETMLDLHKYPVEDNSKDPLRDRMKELGGGKNAHILCVDSGWHYGKSVDPATYDWGWLHGYTVNGFMRLTTRNNYASKPEPVFADFGRGISKNVFMHWVDAKTPPKNQNITLFSERERDLWPSLNQAFFKAKRIKDDVILFEFGNNQPFFKHYLIEQNGKMTKSNNSVFKWKLSKGTNSLSVVPIDSKGQKGIGSSVLVEY